MFVSAAQIGRLTAAGLFALGTLVLVAGPASAASFRVSPVKLTLLAKRPVGSLIVSSGDGAPVAVRVATYRWTQVDGKDVYTPTDDVIASPPIFTAPAGTKQLVRVGLRHRTPGAAYRVMLQEIPGPTAEKGIRIAMTLNLPLYVVDDPLAKSDVRWTAWRGADGHVVIEGRNQGVAYQQVTRIALAGSATPLSEAMGVVLPASMRHWDIGQHPELKTGSVLRLSVRTANGDNEVTANLSAR